MEFNIDINNIGEVKRHIKDVTAHHLATIIEVVLTDHFETDHFEIERYKMDEIYDDVHTEIMIVLNSLKLS